MTENILKLICVLMNIEQTGGFLYCWLAAEINTSPHLKHTFAPRRLESNVSVRPVRLFAVYIIIGQFTFSGQPGGSTQESLNSCRRPWLEYWTEWTRGAQRPLSSGHLIFVSHRPRHSSRRWYTDFIHFHVSDICFERDSKITLLNLPARCRNSFWKSRTYKLCLSAILY